jgi:hypothetical protein
MSSFAFKVRSADINASLKVTLKEPSSTVRGPQHKPID